MFGYKNELICSLSHKVCIPVISNQFATEFRPPCARRMRLATPDRGTLCAQSRAVSASGRMSECSSKRRRAIRLTPSAGRVLWESWLESVERSREFTMRLNQKRHWARAVPAEQPSVQVCKQSPIWRARFSRRSDGVLPADDCLHWQQAPQPAVSRSWPAVRRSFILKNVCDSDQGGGSRRFRRCCSCACR